MQTTEQRLERLEKHNRRLTTATTTETWTPTVIRIEVETPPDEAETHDEGSDVQRYEDEERRRPESSEGKE